MNLLCLKKTYLQIFMQIFMKKNHQVLSAFTLIEIMVVVVIIGII